MVSFFYQPRTDFAFELISDNKKGYNVTSKSRNDIVTTKVVINTAGIKTYPNLFSSVSHAKLKPLYI